MKRLNLIFLSLCLMISACTNASPVTPTATLEPTPTQWVPPTLMLSPTLAPQSGETLTPPSSSATLLPTLSPMTTSTRSDLGKLAYVQGGDIWVKALPDGQPLPLTTDGHNREPRWSPSGQWIAFRDSNARVWVIRADGSGGRLLDADTSIGVYAWAPTIDRLVYTADDRTLLTVNADGSDRQAFLIPDSQQPITGVQSLAWSPDGQWLALTRGEIPKQGAPPDRYDSVWRVRADGTEAKELFNGGRPSDREFSLAGWSADSRTVLLWINPGYSASILADGVPLDALPVEGGSPVQLATGLDTGDGPRQETVLLHADFIAPARANFDAVQTAVTVGGYRGTWTNKRVGLVDVQTGRIRLLTPKNQAAFSPDWSPNGALAYAAMPDTGDLVGGEGARLGMLNRRIYLVNTQGDPQPKPLTNDSGYRDERPLWSADGAFILFARMDHENRSSLWMISSEGGAPRLIVDELTPAPEWFGYYGYIDWSQRFDWWRGPTEPASSPAAADNWQTYHDSSFGFGFQYPSDWHQAVQWYSPGWRGIVERIEVTHLSQAPGNNAAINIDIWQSQNDLLTWLHAQSPDSLALNSATIEGGLDTLTRYNAQLAGYPAVFVYDREHNSGTPDVADVFVADGQYVYRFMYRGDVPDNLANRAIHLRLLETVRLADSTLQGLSLPKTSFITGVAWTPITSTIGSAVFGRVIGGFGAHQPIGRLPLWIGETSSGLPDAYTSNEGYFALTHVPTDTVHIVDDHLAFQVMIPGEGTSVYPGQLKYPLIHPPTYYFQSPTPLSDVQVLLDKGQSINFTSCLVDANWQRPTTRDQSDRVWSKRPFSDASTDWLHWWFDQPAMIYDTIDHFTQSYPDGPNLDSLLADWHYLSGMWNTAEVVDQSGCPYDDQALNDLLARRQIEVWLWGYRALRLQRLDQHFGLEVTAAPGYQIIRFPGIEDAIAIHLIANGREILQLPRTPQQQQ